MPNENEKLARFEKAVFSEAEGQAAQILSEVDSYKEEKLDGVKEEELQRAYDRIQQKATDIRAGFSREITREKLGARQRVLLRRKELVEELFSKAAQRVEAFTQTEGYRAALTGMLAGRSLTGVTVLAREKDLALVRELAGNAKVEESGQIRLGGLIFVETEAHRYDDQTYDSRLKEAEERFYASGKAGLGNMEGVGELG